MEAGRPRDSNAVRRSDDMLVSDEVLVDDSTVMLSDARSALPFWFRPFPEH